MSAIGDKFKALTPVQQTYVVNALMDKTMQNPSAYGLQADGSMRVGDELDLTDIFNDSKEIESLIDKSLQAVVPGSPQEKAINENSAKIKKWMEEHPGERIDESKIASILAVKLEAPVTISGAEKLFEREEAEPEPKEEPAAKEPEISPIPPGAESQLKQDIETAKQRIATLQMESAPKAEAHNNPNLERTFYSDTKLIQQVESAFKSEIDGVYGSSGVLGMGKASGLESKEWREMAKLPAVGVAKFATEDSMKSGLPTEVVRALSKSKKHKMFLEQLKGLMERADGAVRPFERETVEQFLKRLGGYVLRTYQQKEAMQMV